MTKNNPAMAVADWPVNCPLAIDQRMVPQMTHILQNSNLSNSNPLAFFFQDDAQKIAVVTGREPNEVPDGIGVVKITGPLWHSGWWHDYADALAAIQRLNDDQSIQAIMLEINSPGGHAQGVFDVVDAIYALRGGKPIWTVTNETATSAAYALASASDKIIAPRTANVGSIGVYYIHWDYSKMMEDRGIKLTPIFAGDHKLDGHPDLPLSAGAEARIKADIDDTYDLFTKTVARNRNLAVEKVVGTKAEIFNGEGALAAGLIDQVASVPEAYKALAAVISKNSNLPSSSVLGLGVTQPTVLGATKEKQMSFQQALAVAQEKAASKEGLSDDQKAKAFDELLAAFAANPEADEITPADPAGQSNASEAAASATKRVADILACDEAKGRRALAEHFAFNTDMDVDAAKKALSTSPKQPAQGSINSMLGEDGADIPTPPEGTTETAGQVIDLEAIYGRANGRV